MVFGIPFGLSGMSGQEAAETGKRVDLGRLQKSDKVRGLGNTSGEGGPGPGGFPEASALPICLVVEESGNVERG